MTIWVIESRIKDCTNKKRWFPNTRGRFFEIKAEAVKEAAFHNSSDVSFEYRAVPYMRKEKP